MLTIFRSDDEFFKSSELDGRQIVVLEEVKRLGRISNKEVQTLLNVSKATATRVLQELSEEILILRGVGAGAYYSFK